MLCLKIGWSDFCFGWWIKTVDCPRNFLFFFRGKIKIFLLCLKIGWSDFCFGWWIFCFSCIQYSAHMNLFSKNWSSIFFWFLFFFAKIVLYDSVFKKTVHPFLVFFFSSYENWLSIFFSCLWRLVFLLLKFSLTFIFIEVFDLFISGFHCLCHLVVHFFIYTLHVMMYTQIYEINQWNRIRTIIFPYIWVFMIRCKVQLTKRATRWHTQCKLETNKLNNLINMKLREIFIGLYRPFKTGHYRPFLLLKGWVFK